jgi:hypothetical protein
MVAGLTWEQRRGRRPPPGHPPTLRRRLDQAVDPLLDGAKSYDQTTPGGARSDETRWRQERRWLPPARPWVTPTTPLSGWRASRLAAGLRHKRRHRRQGDGSGSPSAGMGPVELSRSAREGTVVLRLRHAPSEDAGVTGRSQSEMRARPGHRRHPERETPRHGHRPGTRHCPPNCWNVGCHGRDLAFKTEGGHVRLSLPEAKGHRSRQPNESPNDPRALNGPSSTAPMQSFSPAPGEPEAAKPASTTRVPLSLNRTDRLEMCNVRGQVLESAHGARTPWADERMLSVPKAAEPTSTSV